MVSRLRQRGSVLLGSAGGMLLVAAGLASAYYVMSTRSEARAAPAAEPAQPAATPAHVDGASPTLKELLARQVEVKTGTATTKLSWSDLGVEVDPDELARTGDGDLAGLGAKAAVPVRVQRAKAALALAQLKARYDRSPLDAYLDLEERMIHDDVPGQGIDVWASIPRLEVAARSNASTVELASVPLPASVTKQSLGIADISTVMGHFTTKFPVTDRDRNYNLKLAASKINGTVLQPHQEWSFNTSVGEIGRAHV